MSRIRNYQEYNTFNKTNISTTPRRTKQKVNVSIDTNSLNQNSTELNNKSPKINIKNQKIFKKESSKINQEEEQPKTPKEILSSLLKNKLGKSLLKLESRGKEQSTTLKFIGKYYIVFEKNLLSLKNGVEKKRKEDEKKQKLAKKQKAASTPNRIRSKTVTSLRKATRENSIFNTERNKNISKINSNLFKKKNGNLEDTPKIRSRTVRSSRFTSSTNLKKKNTKDNINNTKLETPKKEKINNGYRTLNRFSGTTSKNNENSKDEENRMSIKDKNNTIHSNNNNTNKERGRSRSKKNTINSIKDSDKVKRKSIIRRGSKKKLTNKKLTETEADNNKKIININMDIEKNNMPIIIKRPENLVPSLTEIKNINKNEDINLNDNININQIINTKRKEKENSNVIDVLKELEEINEKKPKLEEDKKDHNNALSGRSNSRSRSKNRDKRDRDSSIEKEIKGSLNDVKLMIEGVSDVLDKINSEKKTKFEKKKKDKDKIDEDVKITETNKNLNDAKFDELKKEMNDLFKSEEAKPNNKENENDKININIINTNNINNNSNELIINNNKFEESNINKNNNKEDILIKSSILPENKEENINKENETLKINMKYLKESQIINEEIIKTIENDQDILTNNSILENNLNILNNDALKSNENRGLLNNIKDNNINEELKNSLKKTENKENNKENNVDIIINNDNNNDNNNNINNHVNNNINNNIGNNIGNNKEEVIQNIEDNNNLIEKLEEKIKEKENNLKNEQKDAIKSESNIMHDEQLVNPNQSLDQSSFINQSSIINQSAILAEQYVLISRDPDAPFSIENTLKFDKTQCLGILDFLNFKEKIFFTGITRGFNIERIYLLNNKREEMIRSLELKPRETVEDLIIEIRLKNSNVELSKNFVEFQVARGGAKAVELLNNDLYSKLFKKPILEKNSEEICIVYRVLFTLFGEYDIATIYGDQLFWIKCTEYLIKNSNGKIGTFILDKFKDITFEHQKIFLLNKLLVGMKKKINPNYFSKICGTTGLLIFLIKDTLEYCGVIINDKKTQPARILDNLLYYKNTIDTLAQYIDYLSGIKTYKVREKKDKDNEK